uniref:plectin n=1 Tax=Euleptes europaea TaxID=460621 RepID=UPI00254206A1|nr:plectin [Euleptes europaea]
MVAGMLMPLGQLRSIYELLFRDGVMVAQKERCPRSDHPELPGVSHLHVRRAMGSLLSRGLVRETFAWRHCYWYLTDEGIAHLRDYLRLPPEIVPATLQRIRHPVARVRPVPRPPRTQTVSGPFACPPKPQEASREAYRRKEGLATPAVRAASQGASGLPAPSPAPAPDERDRVQKKTFTKWVNKHLIKAQRHVNDLYEDLRDGHNLISLLEVLSGDTLPRERDVIRNLRLPREKGRMRFHKLQNVQIALDYLKHRQVKLVNIRNDDIADGNPKLTLGLIWTIILHFQISDIQVSGQSEDMTAKEKLLLWSQRMVEGYQGLRCDNFTVSWRDGRLFNAIIHRHKPMLIDMNKVYRQTNVENLEQAFSVAEHELGVTRLLDPEDVDVPQPDEKSIITYVSSLYDAMPRVPDVQDGVKANELQLRWQEYYELVTLLLQWIRHHTVVFEERRFPASYEEIEVLWRQFLKFKETELPAKESDKNRSKAIFQSLEPAVQSGQVKAPPGYHPLDVEKEWGKLHVAILEREKLLRSEFERLERLQRIVSKLQMESGLCEEQLNQADTLLQSDIRLLNAGKAPQKSAEIERDLDKADAMIRSLFNDVQALKDGRHPQGEQMYRRVYRLHERLVAIRTEYNLRLKSGSAPIAQVTLPVTQRPRQEPEDVTLRYLQDLLAWVEENQRRVGAAEWGIDLPTVESQLGSHRGLHQSVEEFRTKIERARADEAQLSPGPRSAYRDCLTKLDVQYAKLLNSSKARLRHLESLHAFVAAATKELMWLNEKEEEEVTYDWSERNSNMAAKKESYSGLMRELEQRERKIKEIQNTGDRLLREEHPGKPTVEAFQAALQTQWSWMLQLCCCIEAHLKENANYFQFFADVKEAEEFLRKTQETLRKKFACDRSITVTRLEDLLQDSLDQKEQLAEYQGQLAGLAKRAKAVVQLKPRSPTTPVKGRLPLQAVCDYKQMEITVHKGDSGTLLSNAQPYKWKVLNAAGSEAVVPSVCFVVPPPNKEALDAVGRLESAHQSLLSLWQQLHIDLRSLLSWQCLQRDIQQIQSWSLLIFRTMPPEDYRQTLRSLETHYQEFLRHSQDAQNFFPDDRLHVQREYTTCTQKYELLLRSLEKGEQEESLCRNFISQLKDIRLQLEGCESRTIHKIRSPLDKDPAKECAQRINDQQQIHLELEGIKKSLGKVSEKTERVLSQPEQAGSAPTLRTELDVTLQKMDQVHSLSSVYLEKLKTINLVIRSTQGAEELVRKYEEPLKGVQSVPADLRALEETKAELKRLREQAEGHQPLFSTLEADLCKAGEVNERMVRGHSERDVDLDRYRERVQQLLERWQAVLAQIDLRQRELEQLGRQLRYYRESYDRLIQWIQEARQRQESIQAVPITDTKAVREQLLQEKKLLEACDRNRVKVEECQRFAKQYIDAIKDYELQLVTYKAQVEPVVSPAKKPKFQSASDSIIQEYVDLRTQYSELTTLTSQYIKFITETLRRLEEEEKAAEKLKKEEQRRLAEVEAQLEKQRQLAEAHARAKAQAEQEAQELQQRMQEEVSKRQLVAVDAAQQKQNIQQELSQMKLNSDLQIQSQLQLMEEAELSRKRVEEEIRIIRLQLTTTEKQKLGAEEELQALRARAEEAERQKRLAQEEAERLRKQVAEEAQKKREAEEELKRKVQAQQQAAREKQAALEDLEALRLQAEEAERRMKQAELEKERQIQVAQEVALRSSEADLQSRRLSFAEKTAQLELSLKQEHITVTHLQEEAERLRRQQLEAEQARDEAEKELEKWRQKANEALRLRLQAEEVAHKKALAQEEAEKQKEDAEREARKRAKAEESALRQKELAEEELEKQRRLAEGTAQHKLQAEQELIRLKAEMENGEQQRLLLEEELFRLKAEVSEAIQKRKELEEELAKLRAEMELLLRSKAKAEEESRSTSEKSKQILEVEASKLRELAEEAARLRALSEEAKRQRQLAEEEAARQRAEAERILKEKLAAINEASQLKAEAEIALKEKEAENERLRRLAEDEAYQRRQLEEQAAQHKRDIEEKIAQLKQSSASELERQKGLVDDTLKQRRIIEEEIRILKIQFEKASVGKADLEEELGKIKHSAEMVQQSKEQAEREAEKLRQLAGEEENRRREAEEKVQKILLAEREAGRQRKAALEEVERLKARVEEAKKQKELAERESERQIQLAQEAAQKRIAAEEKAHLVAVRQKEQEMLQTRQQEQSLLDKLREEAARARKAAEEAEQARVKAEQEATLSRQLVEEAERLKQHAEEEAQAQAKAQGEAEKLRKEAEREAAKRAQAEKAALRQKQLADADMEKHKKFAEQTLRQKAQVEQELAKVKLQQEETDHQKNILEEELQRLKDEVTEAMKQKAQAEEELFKVKIHMEELIKLKTRIEEENKVLIMKDKDNMQKFLVEEAEKMKQVAEEAARLSVEAQEAARMRKLAEEDLAQQRALAEKILKEKMQAVQEATRLKAEAEVLQKQKDLAQEHAKKLQEDKDQMLQQLAEETEGFQRTLEAERKRQLEMSADAERLKLQVSEMSRAQAKAEEEARRFKKQAEEISQKLHQTELSTQEKMTLVQTLEIQRHQSGQDAEKLRQAIAELEKEKEKLKREAGLLQQKAEEMQMAQKEQLRQETQMLQQSFLSEKDTLLQKERFVEEEKAKLEKLFQDEVNKARGLKAEQDRQQKEMEEEKQRLRGNLEEARKKQAEAEENVRLKQEELQRLEEQRRQQEKRLAEENQKLREKLERLQEEHRAALAQTREIMIQTDDLLQVAAVPSLQAPPLKAVPNGRDVVDGIAQNGEPELAFDGIRQKVPAQKLAEAGILSRENLEKLAKGTVTTEQLSQRDDIRRYLQGTSSIAGLLIKPANEKMSIYQAWKRQLLSPGTALILLEAQAASGFIVDPVRNRRMSVNEAVKEGMVGPELHNKLLSAERAVTGYKDPYTGDKISLFQAMTKDLIVKDHGIRLLEAQIATGGIIDPINSHRLPVQAAYKRGYFDEAMQQILSDPTDDTKGFFDPNTHENLTYLQLMERCVTDPETGLFLLPLTGKAAAGELACTDQEAKDVFQKATVSAPFGKFKGKTVTIWEIINSEYFTEEQRRDLLRQYKTGKITVEKIIKVIITVVEESEKKSQLCFDGLRAPVPAAELLESNILNQDLYNQLQQGKKSVKDVAGVDSIKRYLKGSSAIAGVLVESTGQKLLLSEALKKSLLKPEVALMLLEAQAGTGYILDPVRNEMLPVDEAVRAGMVGPELHEKLLSAEKAVTGYKDPYTGQVVPLFQALQKGLIPKDTGIRLLDAQLATGGIIDPVHSHRLPLEAACRRGCFSEEMHKALSAPADEAKLYYDPNGQERITYTQLQARCPVDKQTGLHLLPLSEQAIRMQQEEVYSDSQAKESFDKTAIEVPAGNLKGKTVTIWELIHSEYFTEEQRRELIRQYKSGKVTIERVIKIIITIVEEAEAKKQEKLTFSGLRAPVPASRLLESRILSEGQYEQLKDGRKSVKELSEAEAVRRFLQGSEAVAGVYVEGTKEKLSIYEAMRRNLLLPSTAAILLEAQAATGFLVDPIRNQKMYVNEAVKAGLVGPELHEKLLSAEKAVTGYKDPYSGNTISLFEALKKGLVLREHATRLLEAQLATGGIIDPVHSHRLPVEVAYRRGYLDEAMNRTLSDPTDDTKGFFDPNTKENLTYLQLKERCVEDPETGLYLLPLTQPERPAIVETTQVYTEAETKKVFEETQIDIPVGDMAGSSMTLWDIMHSDLLPEEQRKRLMEEFRSGQVTKERMIIIIIEIIEKTEIIRQQDLTSYDYVRRRITAEDLYEARIISLEIYNELKQSSKTIREVLEIETIWKYLYGTGCITGIYIPSSKQKLGIYQALKKGLISPEVARPLLEAQAATGFIVDPIKNEMLTVDEAVRKGVVGPEMHDRLLSAERAVTGYRDPYSEQKISLFQAMKKDLIPSEEALRLLDAQLATGGVVDPHLGFHLPLEIAYQRGYLNRETYERLSEPSEVRSYVDPSTDEKLSYAQILKRCKKDENTGCLLLPLGDTRKLTFRGLRKQITVEELVRSKVMDEATAQRLQDGLTSVEEVSKNLQKFLEGTSCIAGVYVDSTKERLSVYQAMKKGIIRPGTAFELLEAQAATGYVIDPIKGLKLTVEESVRMGIVGPEFKDKLLSAERAVTGYKDPYSGKLVSLFQAMKKGLILKDHGIRLLEAQIATGGIIDPEESHRLPVEVAYKRGLFDEEMNEILLDPSDDTKGFFDPNTEENLTYLQLMERCITDPETGLCLLPLKEKKRERKTSSKSSVRKRRVVIVDPETGKEMSVYEAYRKGLIDHQTYLELSEQECEWEEITISSSDGVVKSMIIDRRSGRQYDIDDAIAKGLIDQSALDQYRSGSLSITEFADMLSGNMSGFRSRSSSVGSSSSYPISPAHVRGQLTSWSDPAEETGPVAGILDTDTLEKVSITEAMHRNLVDNITGQRLLEAQACTGGIIDPSSGEKFAVADAVNKGLVDKTMVDRINLAQKAFNGFEDPRTKSKMSAAQALKKGWLYYEAGQRFLEVQYLTGGLIEPDATGRVSLDEALQKGTIDARTAQKLRDVNTYSKYLTCPKTKLKISYKEAMDRSMVEEGTGLRLLEASSQSSKGYYSPYNVSGSGSASGSRSGSRTGSRQGSRRGSFDATGSGFSMSFSSSSYSASSYGRRYPSGPSSCADAAGLSSPSFRLNGSGGGEESQPKRLERQGPPQLSVAGGEDPCAMPCAVRSAASAGRKEEPQTSLASQRHSHGPFSSTKLLKKLLPGPSATPASTGMTSGSTLCPQSCPIGWPPLNHVDLALGLAVGCLHALLVTEVVQDHDTLGMGSSLALPAGYKMRMPPPPPASMAAEGFVSEEEGRGSPEPQVSAACGCSAHVGMSCEAMEMVQGDPGSNPAEGLCAVLSWQLSVDAGQKFLSTDATVFSGCSSAASSPNSEEGPERAWPRCEGKERSPGVDVREQLLSLRHWLDALEKRLPGLPGQEDSALEVSPGAQAAATSRSLAVVSGGREVGQSARAQQVGLCKSSALLLPLQEISFSGMKDFGYTASRMGAACRWAPGMRRASRGTLPEDGPGGRAAAPGGQDSEARQALWKKHSSHFPCPARLLLPAPAEVPPGWPAGADQPLKGEQAAELTAWPPGRPARRTLHTCGASLLLPEGREPLNPAPGAMGNSGGRPSCLGVKGQKSEDFLKDSYLKDLGLDPGAPSGRNNAEGGHAGPPEKPPLNPMVIENGWPLAQQGSPLPKQDNRDVKVQHRGLSCNPLKARLEAAWAPPGELLPRGGAGSSWAWKPLEVTEVTEVTETVVTEIVEVTEYPSGDKSHEPVVTRTVKVLTECAGALPEAVAFLGERQSPDQARETLGELLNWVRDMEDLVASQKAPSSEAKVVKAQLREQKGPPGAGDSVSPGLPGPVSVCPSTEGLLACDKVPGRRTLEQMFRGRLCASQAQLLKRLLEERRAPVERMLQAGETPLEPAGRTDGHERNGGLANLREKWTALIRGAEARHSCLEQILPAAQTFQQSVDAFQDWLSATERQLAQLWHANGSLSQAQDSHQQIQDLSKEIQAKPGELEGFLRHGQRLLEMVSGEEAQLAQEKMDSLRMRFLIVGRSCTDILHRLEQTLEASSRLGPTQEDLALWLSRMERELPPQGRAPGDGPGPLAAADREKGYLALAQLKEGCGEVALGFKPVLVGRAALRSLGRQPKSTLAPGSGRPSLPTGAEKEEDASSSGRTPTHPPGRLVPSPGGLTQLGLLSQFEQALGSGMAHGSHLLARLEELSQVHLDAHALHLQITDQKLLSAEILHHCGLVERLVALAEPLLGFCSPAVKQQLQPLVQPLQEQAEHLLRQSPACAMRLEQAQLLLAQYAETREELSPWLEETQRELECFSLDALSCDTLKDQQELLQSLREAVAEHKPLMAKLQRVLAQLAQLCPQEASPFQQGWQQAEEQYGGIQERVGQAAAVLEEALPRYSQLSERLELMAESLERLRSHVQNPPPTWGDSAWLREQVRENSLRLADLEKLGVALETLRGQGAELLATMPAGVSGGIHARVEQLRSQWEGLWRRAEEQESWLQGLLALADRFWHGLADLGATLSETLQGVLDLVEVSSDPEAIQAGLGTMQVLREEIDGLQSQLDSLGALGVELMSSCGDLDKPDVTKSLDDLYASWNSLSKMWVEQQSRLEEHLQASLLGQETVERLSGWMEMAEVRIAEEFLVGGDPGVVKQQLLELKDFKRELYQCRVDMESLRHWGGARGAANRCPPDALGGLQERWSRLEEEIVSRQHQLEEALLGLGHFQSQLEGLLQWLLHTTEQLQDRTAPCLDLQSCEIELAKHKVLQNDVVSRTRTVQSVTEAGEGLLVSVGGPCEEGLQGSLQQLRQRWDFVLAEMASRQLELENNLSQAQDVALERTELLQWLDQAEVRLFSTQPPWGHPETAKEKLAAHLELCKETEAKQEAYDRLRGRLRRLLASSPPPWPSSTEHSLSILEQKWGRVASLVQERKDQLSEGLTVTTEFHSTSQELLKGVGVLEEALGVMSPPSFVLETLTHQIQEQKWGHTELASSPVASSPWQGDWGGRGALACGPTCPVGPCQALLQEAQAHRERLVGLEALAARMKDFSQRQDCRALHSLVLTAEERLARVLQQLSQRGSVLEEARKRAKQFRESWQLLLDWLDESESTRETLSSAPKSPEEVKGQLGEHKEFQKGLRTKRPVYEATLRSGRLLREKALLPEDAQALDEMLGELKERWEAVCSQAAERQHKLEEALLFSGHFPDALQTLMDWLYRVEPQLAEETPVAGDRDVVSALMDKHKAFQKELGQRASCVRTLRRSVRDLTWGSQVGDSQWLQNQVEELGHRWELVCRLSISKQARLEAALRQAEEFDRLVRSFLGHLSEAEKRIKCGVFPAEATAVQERQSQLKEVSQSLRCHQLELDCITSLGEEMLSSCHPDAVITLRSWLTVTRSRFQEVESWAQQQEGRLQAQASSLATEQEEAARLMDWIAAAEESLNLRDLEPLPEDAGQLQELSAQHAVFMEQLNQKQPDVEKVTKSSQCRLPRDPPPPHKLPSRRRSAGRLPQRAPAAVPLDDLGLQSPLLARLARCWQQLWLLALDRQYRLEKAQQHLQEVEEFSHFDFAIWRKRYLQWISHMKSRALDVFRGIDRDQDGRISQQEFIEGVLSSRFPTNVLEMSAVASIFDLNGDGYIDYYEFVSALHPSRDLLRRNADTDQIQDEVNRQVSQCSCAKRFQVEQISANRYRFGESQQLRMVRILRSTLMVRVGGGWIALDEFLVKNDPCRVKGRTNMKLNEKYLAPESSACRGAGSAKAPSPGLSMSSLSLYSSASAPSSPLSRKCVLRRTRSGDRCPPSRSPLAMESTELTSATAAEDGSHLHAEAAPPPPAAPTRCPLSSAFGRKQHRCVAVAQVSGHHEGHGSVRGRLKQTQEEAEVAGHSLPGSGRTAICSLSKTLVLGAGCQFCSLGISGSGMAAGTISAGQALKKRQPARLPCLPALPAEGGHFGPCWVLPARLAQHMLTTPFTIARIVSWAHLTKEWAVWTEGCPPCSVPPEQPVAENFSFGLASKNQVYECNGLALTQFPEALSGPGTALLKRVEGQPETAFAGR